MWHEIDHPGNWEVVVFFEGDTDYDYSVSAPRYITVEPQTVEPTVETTSPTNITLDSIPSSIPLDYGPFMVTGKLTTSDGTPLSGKSVWMDADSGDGRNQGGNAITDSNGYFERELYFWHEADPGNWEVVVFLKVMLIMILQSVHLDTLQ